MAEKKDGGQEKAAAAPAPDLGAAGESSDPVVHQLLAERATVESNGDDAAVKALTEQLAGLGVK